MVGLRAGGRRVGPAGREVRGVAAVIAVVVGAVPMEGGGALAKAGRCVECAGPYGQQQRQGDEQGRLAGQVHWSPSADSASGAADPAARMPSTSCAVRSTRTMASWMN